MKRIKRAIQAKYGPRHYLIYGQVIAIAILHITDGDVSLEIVADFATVHDLRAHLGMDEREKVKVVK